MQGYKCKEPIYQNSELSVIFWADAVVQPVAMMIKLRATPVACSTMLCTFLYVNFANVTEQLNWLSIICSCDIKVHIVFSVKSLLSDERIGGNLSCDDIRIVSSEDSWKKETKEDESDNRE